MSENNFVSNLESLFDGMNSFATAGTIVGEAVHVGDTIFLPLAEVSFGCAAGAFQKGSHDSKNNNAAGGMGGKVVPSAILVIQGDKIKLVNVKNQDSMTKILDMIPDVLDRFSGNGKVDKMLNKAKASLDDEDEEIEEE